MKENRWPSRRVVAVSLAAWAACACFSAAAGEPAPRAAGLWHFDGDFSAAVGRAIELEGQPVFEFGRCSSWGLPRIGDSDESILRIGRPPRPSTRDYFKVFPGLAARGSDRRVNQYTLLMDVLFTQPHGQDGWTSILNLDGANSDLLNFWYRGGGEKKSGAARLLHLGFKATEAGVVPGDAWLRVGFRVQVRNGKLRQDIFLNGQNVGLETVDCSPLDGRGSLPAAAAPIAHLALWGNPYPHSNCQGTGYFNSLAIFGTALSDEALASLGGVSPGGIPGVTEARAKVEEASRVAATAPIGPGREKGLKYIAPASPVVVPLKPGDFTPMQIPAAAGAPYFSTHDFSEAIIPDGEIVYYAYFGKGSHITSYNSKTEHWSAPVLLGGVSDDQYQYPDIVMDREGHIHAFYGGHGRRDREDDPLSYRRTVRPRDISSWEETQYVGSQGAFPRPYVLRDGRLMVLHRGSQWVDGAPRNAGWGYIESADGGRTWSPFRRLVDGKYVLYGGGAILERPDASPVISWGWCWWDEGSCDLGTYYSPNPAVPCKYDDVLYAVFSLDEDTCWDASGAVHPLPAARGSLAPVWRREYLSVADSTVNPQGEPVVLFSDYRDRTSPRMLIARHARQDGWLVEEPLPGIPVAANNMRIRTAGSWTTIVGWEIGADPGLFVIQRSDPQTPFCYRKLTRQRFPFPMHPTFKEDASAGKLHIFWAEGDRISSSRLMYGALPLDPTRSAP